MVSYICDTLALSLGELDRFLRMRPADPFIEEAWTTRPLAPPTQNTDTNPDTTTNTDTSYNKNTNTDINNDNGSNTLNIYINTTYSF